MFKKKIMATFLAMGLSASVLVGCSSDSSNESADTNDKVSVKLLVTGALGDKGFNDSANAGMKRIEEQFGDKVDVEVIEMGFDQTKFEPSLMDASESDADVIITGGWDMKEHVEKTAEVYQDKKYIVYDTDVNYDEYDLDNVYSMTYKQNEAGFLVGTLAALVTNSNMEFANKEKVIGFVGARDTSAVINDSLVGYIEGAKFADKDVKVEVAYIGSFTDTAKAKELTLAQYSNGADVVFTAAGPASAGSIEAARDSKKYVIGVDSDQALAYEGKEEQKYIISSALKNIDISLAESMDLYLNDSLEFGTHSVLGIKEDAVGIAKNDIYMEMVTKEIRNQINETIDELKTDKIKVKSAIGMKEEELKSIIKEAK